MCCVFAGQPGAVSSVRGVRGLHVLCCCYWPAWCREQRQGRGGAACAVLLLASLVLSNLLVFLALVPGLTTAFMQLAAAGHYIGASGQSGQPPGAVAPPNRLRGGRGPPYRPPLT